MTAVELSALLAPLDKSALECDGMTRAISTILSHRGIPHDVRIGSVDRAGCCLPLHLWIELENDNWTIDYRLNMWSEVLVPHGVFRSELRDGYEEGMLGKLEPLPPGLFQVLTGFPLDKFL